MAAKDAAEATTKSAEIAHLAFLSGRPYLPIEEVKLTGLARRQEQSLISPVFEFVNVKITFKNYGRPARIDEIVGAIKIVDGPLLARDYSECRDFGIEREVVGTLQILTTSMMLPGNPNDLRGQIQTNKKQLIVYGRVKYSDLTGNRYIRGFYWEMDVGVLDILDIMEPRMIPGPKTRNYDEEDNTGLP